MNFTNMKVSSKVMVVIALLGVVSVGVAGGGILAMSHLDAAATKVQEAGSRAVLIARMNAKIVDLNRNEYRLASDPGGDNFEETTEALEAEFAAFDTMLASLKAGMNAGLAEEVKLLEEKFASYRAEVEETVGMADQVALADETELARAEQAVVNSAHDSREEARALEEASAALVEAAVAEAGLTAEAAHKLFQTASIMLLVGAGLGIAVGVLLGFMVAQQGVVAPIRRIVQSLQGLAHGDLSTKVFGADRKDEVGEIAATTQIFKDNLIEAQRLREEQERARAEREKRNATVNDSIARFQTAAEEVIRTVASAATELQAASNTLSASAAEAASQANSVAAAAEEMSSNVQSVASSTEELAASVREIGSRAQDSHSITQTAVNEVTRTNAMVREMENAAQKIGAVVSLIGDIASQTNLLALNATIEAARAGDMGKGFAVVAGEVKALAEQSARATEDITKEIESIQGVTRKSVEAMAAISSRINEISSISSTIASAVQQQSAATLEISRNVQEASSGTTEVTVNITNVSTAANETGAAASQVQTAASELAHQSSILRKEFDTFIAVVRAA
jgi:methyl-accepting chemotaxis protein